MASLTKKSFVWLWIAALFSATMGLSVQQVYCYCVGKTTISFFEAHDACQAGLIDRVTLSHDACQAGLIDRVTQSHPVNKPDTDCCKKTVPEKKSCCKKPDSENKGCTKKTTKVFQLKTEFEVGSTDLKKLDSPKTWALPPGPPASLAVFLGGQKIRYSIFERPPPSLSGRMICVRHGVSRC